MLLRNYHPKDCKLLADLFFDTVHFINRKDYTKKQLSVWATGNINLKQWNKSFLEHITVVALKNNSIVGFGDISKTGYLDRLFVHKDYQNKKIATAICNQLENAVNTDKTTAQSSITAKPFFEKRGYQLVREQNINKNGIFLTNYFMEKKLSK